MTTFLMVLPDQNINVSNQRVSQIIICAVSVAFVQTSKQTKLIENKHA